MRPSLFRILVLFSVWFSLTLANGLPARAEITYKFGVVPQFEPRKLAAIWLPVLDELSKRTGFHFTMVGSSEIPHFETAYLEGEYDFAYVNPRHAIQGAENFGSIPLVRDGSRTLAGILVVKKDGPVQNIKALDGQVVAFPAPNALAASLVIRAELMRLHGIVVKPLYVYTHSSAYLNVVLGRTIAGGGVLTTFEKQKPGIQNQLRIIYTTKAMPPHPITAHPRVPLAHIKMVTEAILDMSKDATMAKLLEGIPLRQPVPAFLSEYNMIKGWELDKL
ncbi:MAG: phosphate/phosphite/phosphonate ABC transporter substrate-binding protein [Rhodospirillales bacterium]|nr:phosphate/phosphite/phosphonate ABC transporter substrate-binding protein [Rhodospirillales bacterium]